MCSVTMSLSVLPRAATLDFVPLEGSRLTRVLEWQQNDNVTKPATTKLFAQRFYGSGADSDVTSDDSSHSDVSSVASSLFDGDHDESFGARGATCHYSVPSIVVEDPFVDLDNEVEQVFVTPATPTSSDRDSDQLFDDNLNVLTSGTRIMRRVSSPTITRLVNLQRNAADAMAPPVAVRINVRSPYKMARPRASSDTRSVISLGGINDAPLPPPVALNTARRYDSANYAYTLATLDVLFSKGLADENAQVRAYAIKIKAHYVNRIEQHRMSLAQATRKYERHAQLIKRTSDLSWLKTHYTYTVWHALLQMLPRRPLWQRSDGETTRAVAAHYGQLYEHILSYSNQFSREPDADRLYVVLYTPDCEFRQRNDFIVKADFRWANCFYATLTGE